MKNCSKCGVLQDSQKCFHKCNVSPDGRHSICKECRRTYNASYLVLLRRGIRDKLGDRCSSPNCRWLNEDGTLGCTDQQLLQIDHVFGDGYLEKRTYNPTTFYYYLQSIPDEELKTRYQLLCVNCNWIKRNLNKEYRKKQLTPVIKPR